MKYQYRRGVNDAVFNRTEYLIDCTRATLSDRMIGGKKIVCTY